MAESEQTQVIQPKKKMGFGKKLIIILAVIVAFLGVCSLMIVHQNNQLEKKFYQLELSSQMQRYIKINFKRRFPVQAFAWTLI